MVTTTFLSESVDEYCKRSDTLDNIYIQTIYTVYPGTLRSSPETRTYVKPSASDLHGRTGDTGGRFPCQGHVEASATKAKLRCHHYGNAEFHNKRDI